MHILMISDVYFPRVNGVSTSIQSFRQTLVKRGHKVTLIAPDYGEITADETDIIRVPSRVVVIDKEDRMMKRGKLRDLIVDLDPNHFDLVHIQTPFIAHYEGIRIARTADLPVVVSYHTFFEEYLFHYVKWLPRELTRFAARWFSRQQCNQVDGIIVPSDPMKQVLLEYGIKKPTVKIPTGIKMDDFHAVDHSNFRGIHNIPSDKPMLLFVGRVAFEKNISFLLDVAAEMQKRGQDFTLVIAGEGPAEKALKKKAAALGLSDRVLFIGYLKRTTDLPACYQSADVFVFSSRTETQGLVLLEAMANGTPVVSTAVMGTADVMGDNRGGFIAGENIEDFAGKVQQLLADKELYTERKQDALEYVQEWTEAAMTCRLIDFYTQILPEEDDE